MKSKAKPWSTPKVIGGILGFFVLNLCTGVVTSPIVQPVVALSSPQDNNPQIAPIQSHPNGKTYGQWAAAWWQWALQTPKSINTLLLDKGEVDCSIGQKGQVWFIGGSFSSDLVVRKCFVPTGTKLLFPLINATYGAFQTDLPEQKTEKFLRAQVDYIKKDNVTLLEAEIDGVRVKNPSQYFEQSPLFNIQLPKDNIYGADDSAIPQLLLSPSVDQGYYLLLEPLNPGEHTIKWRAKISSSGSSLEQNVTYNIVVKPGHN